MVVRPTVMYGLEMVVLTTMGGGVGGRVQKAKMITGSDQDGHNQK